jgi:branched-chain amino acid transport system substrate-binding protein
LTAAEKLILEKKPHAIALGNFRSEVLLATMDLMSKYKLPYICSIAMTPLMQKKVTEDYEKYKYIFRNAINAPYLAMYLSGVMGFTKKEYGFNKAYIITQDVLWAKGTGGGLEKWFKENGWEVAAFDTYATGSSTSLIPDDEVSKKPRWSCLYLTCHKVVFCLSKLGQWKFRLFLLARSAAGP